MKKQYKVKDISTKDMSEGAAENHAGAISRDIPLVVLEGENAKAVPGGVFSFPSVKETDSIGFEIAFRILGTVITSEMLNHLPTEYFTSDDVGTLLAHFPFEYHKRFGETYSNRVCSESTRTRPCPICKTRASLLRKDSPHADQVNKYDILDAGFGTKYVSAFVARVYFDGEDRGVCLVTLPRTNPFAKNAKHNSFFDRIDNLKTPKKLMASETLPVDYFGCGDGARWIIAEYQRSRYTPKDATTNVEGKKNNRGGDYWELLEVKSTKEIPGLGKASDIWWPVVGEQTAEEFFDMHAAINFPDPDILQGVCEDAVLHLLRRNKPQTTAETATYKSGVDTSNVDLPTWQELNDMDFNQLLIMGESLGGDLESLKIIGESNIALLRRNLAKMCGIKPTPISSRSAQDTAERGSQDEGRNDIDPNSIEDEDLPF